MKNFNNRTKEKLILKLAPSIILSTDEFYIDYIIDYIYIYSLTRFIRTSIITYIRDREIGLHAYPIEISDSCAHWEQRSTIAFSAIKVDNSGTCAEKHEQLLTLSQRERASISTTRVAAIYIDRSQMVSAARLITNKNDLPSSLLASRTLVGLWFFIMHATPCARPTVRSLVIRAIGYLLRRLSLSLARWPPSIRWLLGAVSTCAFVPSTSYPPYVI